MPKPDKLPAFSWGFKGDSLVLRDQRGEGVEIVLPYAPAEYPLSRRTQRDALSSVCEDLNHVISVRECLRDA